MAMAPIWLVFQACRVDTATAMVIFTTLANMGCGGHLPKVISAAPGTVTLVIIIRKLTGTMATTKDSVSVCVVFVMIDTRNKYFLSQYYLSAEKFSQIKSGSLNKGLYFIKIENKNGRTSFTKFIKLL